MNGQQTLTWVVTAEDARMRLDRYLTARAGLGTRSQIQRLIAAELVRVEERPAKAGTLLRAGQTVRVERPPVPAAALRPEAIDLVVLFEDDWLLAIDKPPGLVVHPAPGHWQGTLVHALLHRLGEASPGLDPGRLGLVHRLDKDTSGVLVVAKDAATLADLARQFRNRAVTKRYLALVRGRMASPRGVVDRPIARHPVHRKRMAVRAGGRAARTRYEVVERFACATLVRLFPESGRTHQIRVHLAALGHPVLGDAIYGRSPAAAAGSLGRHALHAESLAFQHPATGRPVAISAPLPPDFAAALAELRESAARPTSA
jgi:23S rRNA pseudouridine1911/1915/1917 synthase